MLAETGVAGGLLALLRRMLRVIMNHFLFATNLSLDRLQACWVINLGKLGNLLQGTAQSFNLLRKHADGHGFILLSKITSLEPCTDYSLFRVVGKEHGKLF